MSTGALAMHHTLCHVTALAKFPATLPDMLPAAAASSALGTIMVVTTLFVVAGMIAGMAAGMAARSRGRGRPRAARPFARLLAAAGAWPAGVAGAVAVAAMGAVGQWWSTRQVLGRSFLPTEEGWERIPPGAQEWAHNAAALADLTAMQSTAAVCIAALAVLTLVSVAFDPSFAGRTSRTRALLVAAALIAPVLAACGGVLAAVDGMRTSPAQEAIWSTWHILEAGKWAIAGVAACTLMAATPIVVGAAAAGRVVSNRLYHASVVVLLLGLAAWSTSRFATEDLQRGPLQNLEAGQAAFRAFPDEASLLRDHFRIVELPRASECAEESLDLATQDAIALVATPYGADMELLDTAALAPRQLGKELVVVAAVDGRAYPSAIRAGLLRATQAGAQRIAVVTRYVDEERTLTLGSLKSTQVCVAGWLPLSRAVDMVERGAQWSAVAFAATRAERVRDARATAERR